jgi:GTP cyclohydrolase I
MTDIFNHSGAPFMVESLEEGPDPMEGRTFDRPTVGFLGVQPQHVKAMEGIAQKFQGILEDLRDGFGLDIDDENFRETPARVAKMWVLERCVGINSEEACMQILGKDFPAMDSKDSKIGDQLIITTNPAIVYSLCPHHFENVTYDVWSGYIPKSKFIGISKFSRVAELYGRQPILQESYTSGLANILMKALDPLGVIVVVKGRHNCLRSRGAKANPNQSMVTSALRGIFVDEPTYKEEFFKLSSLD